MISQEVRKDFPILERVIHGRRLVYLDNAATSQKPRQVVEAINDYYFNHNANIHRGVHTLADEATRMMDVARRKVAGFIGTKRSEEVIFVRNATEGLNLVAYAYGAKIKAGGEIVVSEMEHHSNLVPWQMLAKKTNTRLKVVALDKEGRLVRSQRVKEKDGVICGGWDELLSREVELVALSYVSNVTGVINPVSRIVKEVRARCPKAAIVIDGSQAVPHMAVDVEELGADFLVFSGHKMLGPTGSGVLWGRKEILEAMPPFLYGGDMISEVSLSESRWNELPWKFEAGTPDIGGAVGLGAAVDYLKKIGMKEVADYEEELTTYTLGKMQLLEEEGWFKIIGPRKMGERAGVISFVIQGVHAHDAAQVLDNYGIAIRSGQHCAAPLVESMGQQAVARVSFYIYNTKEEIDYLINTLPKVRDYLRK